MKGFDNPSYLFLLVAFNLLALIFLFTAFKYPRISRILFFLLFGWACWMNWTTSQRSPNDYLQYADLNLSSWYRDFINGWFSRHIPPVVGIIATCQGMIAMSMLLKGTIFKIGCSGGIIFLTSIAPFGVGSGFPCTIIFAIALGILFKKGNSLLWAKPTPAPFKMVQ
ncbi:MAG: hypothetical protein ABI688_00010 [Bacteroidota bacterium]